MLPEQLLHTPTARRLIARLLVAVVDGGARAAELRQRASRADMARAIAGAEQAEFDRTLRAVTSKVQREGLDPRRRP